MTFLAFLRELVMSYRIFYYLWDVVVGQTHTRLGDIIDSIPPPRRTLPFEIIECIIDEAVTPDSNSALIPLDNSSFQPLVVPKSPFGDIRGLSSTSRWIRSRVLARWFKILVVRETDDWDIVAKMRICAHIMSSRPTPTSGAASTLQCTVRVCGQRRIHAISKPSHCGYRRTQRFRSSCSKPGVFMRFPNLHTAVIDAHNDFVLHARNPGNDAQSIGHYRLVAPQLPNTLRRLWITNAHGPDVRVIQNACVQCPQLEDLLIDRCTLFSPRLLPQPENEIQTTHAGDRESPGCHFWNNFPNDHDAYFASIGVTDYAHSLAAELRPLKHLKHLHMGLYLTPTEALAAHRTHHSDLRIHGSLWDPVCQSCLNEFGSETQEAEESASTALGYEIPNLEEVSWSSFYSVKKAGRSTFKIKHQPNGEVVCRKQTDKSATGDPATGN
ncbi:unnamed protein product [Rhizoctonia solani]|uniref:Uncharacterized protein n=1 Tax=Rhizoctonia solani TaxID=456999 RepID=A0A8H3DTW2_9AGAM|nr:unnamed protein product [Rhizoctonia solani]